MPQDASFIFNNQQSATNQNFVNPNPTSQPMPTPPSPNTATPISTIPNVVSPIPTATSPVANLTQTLPDISTFSNNQAEQIASATQSFPSPIITVPTPPTLTPPLSADLPLTITSTEEQQPTTQTLQPDQTQSTLPVGAPTIPDFRALAEEIITEQSNPNQAVQTPVVTQNDQLIMPSPLPTPAAPVLTVEPMVNEPTPTENIKLESDPFIQEVHEQNVQVEKEALETLINSSRIEPELKDHLRVELLKFKDMENDIAPIDQSINNIAAEIMAPEPPAPVVNPVQAIPPQQPM